MLSSFSCHQRFWFGVGDVHVLGTDAAAVGLTQCVQQLAQVMVSLPKNVLLVLNRVSRSASVKP
jgi:hypothetical protein